jgi:hypothetical protein
VTDAGSARSFACEVCGATAEYAPGTDTLRCPHCATEQPIPPVGRAVREHAYTTLVTLPLKQPAAQRAPNTFRCPNCQAVTETDSLSDRCQFCAAALVADPSRTERVVPEAVVPFGLDRAATRAALRKWTRSRWFAPSDLKKVTEAETTKGSYLPHWTYDANTFSDYTGQRGDHYYVTQTYTDSNGKTQTRQVRHTRWTSVSGSVTLSFDDLLVTGTTHVEEEQLDKLEPWPLAEAKPYQDEYLAGFQTVRYDIEPESGFETAKKRMNAAIRSQAKRQIGGDEQRVHKVATSYADLTFKLMLLPVWFLSYLHHGKTWQVMVNARTAEVIGERPYSVPKIVAVSLAAAMVIGAAVWLYLRYRH